MRRALTLIFATLILALPTIMASFSIDSFADLLQLEHEKQLELRLRNDLQAQSQLTGTVFEIYQHFTLFMIQTDQSYERHLWPVFAKSIEKTFDAFMKNTAAHFLLPFEAGIAYDHPEGPKQLTYKDGNRISQSVIADLTQEMRNYLQLLREKNGENALEKLRNVLKDKLGFFFNISFLRADSFELKSNRVVKRESDSMKMLLSLRAGQDYLMNALFDLTSAGINSIARSKAGRWKNRDSGLIFFGGGAKVKPICSSWFETRPELANKIVKIVDAGFVKQTTLIIDGHLVLFTLYDPKVPWQVAIAAPLPVRASQKEMEFLLCLFAIAGCSVWKLSVEKIVFERALNFSLRNFIIIVFILVSLMPFASGIYLTGEYVIANFKVQKNQVAENLSKDLLDLDLSTFSQFRDSLNRVKGLSSIETIASFTGLPPGMEVIELVKATFKRLVEIKGKKITSKIWVYAGGDELTEVFFDPRLKTYVANNNHDKFVSEVFVPRFREFLQSNVVRATMTGKNDQISFDEVKGEILDSVILNTCGETTYFNMQKDLGTLIRLESFLDSNAVISIPIFHQGKIKYVFSYVFSSSEIRGHFPEYRLNTDPGKPIVIALYGNDKFLNSRPENLQTIAAKLPALTSLVKQSFLTTSRLMMQDVTASGSPVYETLPAKYSDYVICGQRNTRSLESITSELTTVAVRYFAVLAATGLLIALLTSFYFTIPVRQLTAATMKIVNEDYSIRLLENHPDEFALSAAAFNKMASGLAEGRLLRHFVSESVRNMTSDSGSLNDGQAKSANATVLFSSIRNFASLQKLLGPEQTFALMQTHLSAAVAMASKYGGEIDKMIEDKVMLVFTHVNDNGRAAADAALMAATHIQNTMARQGGHQTAVGINSGEVVSGIMGAASVRLAKTVVGDTVNLAARLASVASSLPTGGIVVAGATVELAQGSFIFTKLPISSVKGKTHAVEAFLATEKPAA